MEAHQGDLVRSLAGRDKEAVFLVLQEDATYLWLANGKCRRAEKPKRKKRRHTTYLAACDEKTRQKLLETGRLTNRDIRKALAIWAGAHQNCLTKEGN